MTNTLIYPSGIDAETGEPQILLEDEDGSSRWLSGVDLAARIGELRDQQRARLAAAGVPAVIAMQGNLTMATAAQFMPAFLRELHRDGLVVMQQWRIRNVKPIDPEANRVHTHLQDRHPRSQPRTVARDRPPSFAHCPRRQPHD